MNQETRQEKRRRYPKKKNRRRRANIGSMIALLLLLVSITLVILLGLAIINNPFAWAAMAIALIVSFVLPVITGLRSKQKNAVQWLRKIFIALAITSGLAGTLVTTAAFLVAYAAVPASMIHLVIFATALTGPIGLISLGAIAGFGLLCMLSAIAYRSYIAWRINKYNPVSKEGPPIDKGDEEGHEMKQLSHCTRANVEKTPLIVIAPDQARLEETLVAITTPAVLIQPADTAEAIVNSKKSPIPQSGQLPRFSDRTKNRTKDEAGRLGDSELKAIELIQGTTKQPQTIPERQLSQAALPGQYSGRDGLFAVGVTPTLSSCKELPQLLEIKNEPGVDNVDQNNPVI